MPNMKTLTVRQPWAWLIVHGYKTVENRSWSTNYRGSLLIHAAKAVDREGMADLRAHWAEIGDPLTPSELKDLETVGAVVGRVNVIDCTLTPQGDDCEWHNPGAWAWILRNPEYLSKPIPATGRLGLYDLDIQL